MKKMVLNRRGLSEVVTTVLIILVVLAALVLIWAAVRPLLNKASSDIGGSGDCLVLDLETVSCTLDSEQVGSIVANVVVKRGATEGDLTGVRFVFSDGSNSVTRDNDVPPAVLESKTYSAIDLGAFNPASVNVAALVGAGKKVCAPLAEPVVCS